MINITKKVMIFSINIMIILCLFSCSVKEIFVDDNVVQETTQAYISNYYTMDVAPAMRMSAKVSNESFDMVQEDIEEVISNEKKIIKNYNISGETKTFDQSYQILLDEIKKLDGVVDNQSIDNQNISKDKKQKYLYMSVRIPVANADKFNKFLDNNINILSRSESQEDITDNYNDTKLRIETLKQEQTRLNELFSKATTVDELVKIENRLSEISYEIQRLEKRINVFDKKVDYSTFNINISEVILYTEPQNNLPSHDDLIIRFNENLEKCKLFIIGIGIYIFTHLPAIVLCLLVLFIVLLVLQLILYNTKYKNTKVSQKKYKEKVIVSNIDTIDKTKTNNIDQLNKLKKKLDNINQDKQDIVKNDTNNIQKIEVPKSTHYGDVAVRVMSDAEIEHDKQIKAIEEEKYNNNKQSNDNANNEGQLSQAQNIISQDLSVNNDVINQKVDD